MAVEMTENLYRILVEHITNSDNGIAVLDKDDKFIFYNDAFIGLFELREHPVLGHSFEDLLIWMHSKGLGTHTHGLTLEEWLAFARAQYRSARFRHYEVDLTDGRWLLMTEQVNPDGDVVLVANDITTSKKTEFALREAKLELKRLAMTDELTQLPNRRQFMQQLENEHVRTLRYGHSTSLAIMDLDYFKKINDTYGHAGGDKVLVHFAELLRSNSRKGDVAGRLGGEEFALLMPETQQGDALTLLRRIQEKLASETLEDIEVNFSYTFSAGIVELSEHSTNSCNEWLNAADKALYRAKTEGRNRLCLG